MSDAAQQPKEEQSAEPLPITSNKEEDGYFQHLSVDQVFVRVWRIFTKRWMVFLSVAAAAILFQYGLSILMAIIFRKIGLSDEEQQPEYAMFWNHDVTRRFLEDAAAENDDAVNGDDAANGGGDDDFYEDVMDEYEYDQEQSTNPWVLLGKCLHNLMYYIVLAISDGALIRAVTEIYMNQVPEVSSTLRAGVSQLGPLMGAPLLIGLMCLVPFLFLFSLMIVIPSSAAFFLVGLLLFAAMTFLGVVTYHIYPAIVVEKCGAWGSIQRSWKLSEGHRFYIFITQLLFSLFKFVIGLVLAMVSMALGGGVVGVIFTIILYLIHLTVFAALGSILQAVVYFSVRVVKEGLTAEQVGEESEISLATPYKTLDETAAKPNESSENNAALL